MSAETRVKSFIDRILRLKAEQDAISDDIREVYAEAKGEGLDKTALGQVVGLLRKKDRIGSDAFNEQDAIVQLYMSAYEGPAEVLVHAASHTPAYACSNVRANSAGEITDQESVGDPFAANTSSAAREADESAALIQGSVTVSRVGGTSGGGAERKAEPAGCEPAERSSGESSAAHSHSVTPHPPGGTDKAGDAVPSASSAAPFEPPAFLAKPASPLRPHCQNPSMCAGYGAKHCHACTVPMRESEVA